VVEYQEARDRDPETAFVTSENVGRPRDDVAEVVAENPTQVADYKSGKESMFMFFVGQCMKKSKGAGNPGLFQELLKEALK
jgi:Asp-tRNA(Asn)/Glu-tRNA(Gln) amidotransferase B subunit